MTDLVRGTQHSFEASFFDYDGTPMVPSDPKSWPQVVIRDGDDAVVVTGVGKFLAAGQYTFQWYVPTNATLSTAESPWTINWTFVTTEGHTKQFSQTFGVVDRIESTLAERQHTYLTNKNGMMRAMLRWPTQLYNVALQIRPNSPFVTPYTIEGVARNDVQASDQNPQRLINEVAQNGEYLYYYDIGPLAVGEYQLHWTYQESSVSSIDVDVQLVRAVPDSFWHYNAEIRTLVDKLQKATDTVQAYGDADIYTYLLEGIDIINFYPPSTNWTLVDIPLTGSRGVRSAIILASGRSALMSQQIAEKELAFDHNGQTVTLGYSRDYDSVIANIDSLLEKFAEAKKMIFRLANGVAYSGARVKNWRWTNRVYRLDQRLRGVVPPAGAALWQSLGI